MREPAGGGEISALLGIERAGGGFAAHDELWEIAWNRDAPPVLRGLVHDYRSGEAVPLPGRFTERTFKVPRATRDLAAGGMPFEVLQVDREGGVGIVNLDIRRRTEPVPMVAVRLIAAWRGTQDRGWLVFHDDGRITRCAPLDGPRPGVDCPSLRSTRCRRPTVGGRSFSRALVRILAQAQAQAKAMSAARARAQAGDCGWCRRWQANRRPVRPSAAKQRLDRSSPVPIGWPSRPPAHAWRCSIARVAGFRLGHCARCAERIGARHRDSSHLPEAVRTKCPTEMVGPRTMNKRTPDVAEMLARLPMFKELEPSQLAVICAGARCAAARTSCSPKAIRRGFFMVLFGTVKLALWPVLTMKRCCGSSVRVKPRGSDDFLERPFPVTAGAVVVLLEIAARLCWLRSTRVRCSRAGCGPACACACTS
jgi:hypothetical protein